MPTYDLGLEHVSLAFATKNIFTDVTQGVFEGDRIGIVGKNGDGKSSLLGVLSGAVPPDAGRVTRRRDVTVGVLGQRDALDSASTVHRAVVGDLPEYEWAASPRVRQILDGLIADVPWEGLVGELSGGQRRRVDLARLLIGDYDVLMLDEPFSALDSYLREEVEGEVGSLLANFAGTALLVTHNRDEAYRLCKEMIVLNEGQVLRAGRTKEVFADPQSIAAARLTGCKNILPCTPLDSRTVRLDGWGVPLRLALPVPAGCTAVGIRAHDFTPCAADAPNAIPVKAVSTSENPFDWNLICTSPEGTAQLWWKVGKTSLSAAAPGPPQYLCAAPESIMPLKG